MTIYRCYFKFQGQIYYVDSDKGIHYFSGGFWVNGYMELPSISDELKYWIPPSMIEYIERVMV